MTAPQLESRGETVKLSVLKEFSRRKRFVLSLLSLLVILSSFSPFARDADF